MRVDLDNANDRLIVDGGWVQWASLQGGADIVNVKAGGRIELPNAFGGISKTTLACNSETYAFRGGESGPVELTFKANGKDGTASIYNADFTLKSARGWIENTQGSDVSSDTTIGSCGTQVLKFSSNTGQTHKITGSTNACMRSIDSTISGRDVDDDQSGIYCRIGTHRERHG